MNRYRDVIGIFVALTVICASNIQADVVTETFSYDNQSDTTPSDYRITTDGIVGGPGVIEFSDGLASGASIASGVLFFNTSSGTGITDDSVGIGDIPGFNSPFGGPFGSFFSTAQDLSWAFGSIDVAHTPGAGSNATRFRLLATDNAGNEIATSDFTLGSTLTTFNFLSSDFTILVVGTSFEDTQVTGIGIEFFATPNSGDVDALQFQIDNFQITTVPEPGSLIVFVGVGTMLITRRRRV